MKKSMPMAVTGHYAAGGDFDVGPAQYIKPTENLNLKIKKYWD
jgi:hypothetical protein